MKISFVFILKCLFFSSIFISSLSSASEEAEIKPSFESCSSYSVRKKVGGILNTTQMCHQATALAETLGLEYCDDEDLKNCRMSEEESPRLTLQTDHRPKKCRACVTFYYEK